MVEQAVRLGENLVRQVLELGVEGGGPLTGAVPVAEEHLLAADRDRSEAERRLVATHLRLAAGSGFLTGVGGLALLPLTLPAAVAGRYVVATRAAAGIAHLRGYDLVAEEVRTAVLVCLLGPEGDEALERAGVETGRWSRVTALGRAPAEVLAGIGREVGYRLVAKAGDRGVLGLSTLVPLVGGAVGAAADVLACRAAATAAAGAFPALPPGTTVVEGEVVVPIEAPGQERSR